MRMLRSSFAVCATICTIIVLALVIGVLTYGPSSLRLVSHGPLPAPDDGSNGGNLVSHGPLPAPDDGSNGGNLVAHTHGPLPAPDDGSNGGNLV